MYTVYVFMVGQNRIYTPYMTVYLVISCHKYRTYTSAYLCVCVVYICMCGIHTMYMRYLWHIYAYMYVRYLYAPGQLFIMHIVKWATSDDVHDVYLCMCGI
jgi:hypothetical protein